MRTLVGIIVAGHNKDYVLPKFGEMLDACIRPIKGVDVMWATNRPLDLIRKGDVEHEVGNYTYAEDMLMDGREQFRQFAIQGEYDIQLWQGVDALWQNKDDVERVLGLLGSPGVPVVAPLISARADADHAIARRFVPEKVNGSGHVTFSEEQIDIKEEELRSGRIIPSGFPGADNIALRKDVFDVSWVGKHDQWYKRVAEGRTNICCEEWLIRELRNRGQWTWLDTETRVWHVHEDGRANMWKGITKDLSELSW